MPTTRWRRRFSDFCSKIFWEVMRLRRKRQRRERERESLGLRRKEIGGGGRLFLLDFESQRGERQGEEDAERSKERSKEAKRREEKRRKEKKRKEKRKQRKTKKREKRGRRGKPSHAGAECPTRRLSTTPRLSSGEPTVWAFSVSPSFWSPILHTQCSLPDAIMCPKPPISSPASSSRS